jgi:hypothetical protein
MPFDADFGAGIYGRIIAHFQVQKISSDPEDLVSACKMQIASDTKISNAVVDPAKA